MTPRERIQIARKAQHKGRKAKDLKPLYKRLIRAVDGLCAWSKKIVDRLEKKCSKSTAGIADHVKKLIERIHHFIALSARVVWQASERVLREQSVPNEEKLFSIFEEHTELLKRGKAGKDIEFGHMVQIQQTGEKFITDYETFDKKPSESTLVIPALESHRKLFGDYPGSVAGDKGYWSGDEFEKIAEKVDVVSIPKKGRRNKTEELREHEPLFRLAQAFRAGVEGSISFLKRVLGLARCMNKGWKNYASTVGATVFAHNLLILTRC